MANLKSNPSFECTGFLGFSKKYSGVFAGRKLHTSLTSNGSFKSPLFTSGLTLPSKQPFGVFAPIFGHFGHSMDWHLPPWYAAPKKTLCDTLVEKIGRQPFGRRVGQGLVWIGVPRNTRDGDACSNPRGARAAPQRIDQLLTDFTGKRLAKRIYADENTAATRGVVLAPVLALLFCEVQVRRLILGAPVRTIPRRGEIEIVDA